MRTLGSSSAKHPWPSELGSVSCRKNHLHTPFNMPEARHTQTQTHTHTHTQHTWSSPINANAATKKGGNVKMTASVSGTTPTQHNTTQHNTTQHNTTQHNTTQHNTTQHNTTQHKSPTARKILFGGAGGGGGNGELAKPSHQIALDKRLGINDQSRPILRWSYKPIW